MRKSERAIGAAEERRAWSRMIGRNNISTDETEIVLKRWEYESWKKAHVKRYNAKPGGLGRAKRKAR